MSKEEELQEECENCGWDGPLNCVEVGWPRRKHWFCNVCIETGLSKATEYPNQCQDAHLYKCIARGINMIFDAVNEKSFWLKE